MEKAIGRGEVWEHTEAFRGILKLRRLHRRKRQDAEFYKMRCLARYRVLLAHLAPVDTLSCRLKFPDVTDTHMGRRRQQQ